MTTAAERLVALTGLSGVSAAQHLIALGGGVGVASALLVAYSGLGTATAATHLLTDSQVSTVPPWPFLFNRLRKQPRKTVEEDEALLLTTIL